jgi:hypothetical protein
MTSLERTLASVLQSIEDARAGRNALALAALLQRKDAICSALASPEHHWSVPHPASSGAGTMHARMPLVA